LIIKKWPLHPKPTQYQILYGWVEHLAEIYGVNFKKFCRNVLDLTPEETNRLRTILPEKALFILSEGTGVPIDDLRKRDLDTMFKALLEEFYKRVEAHPEDFVHLASKNVYKP
jgi:hypothetical protein